MKEMEKLYQERINRFVTTCNHQEPDRVPILGQVATWAIAYAGTTIQECLKNTDKALEEVYTKPFKDFKFDLCHELPMNRDMKFFSTLGNNSYFISEDGTTLQHDQVYTMNPEDYDQLNSNPTRFFAENFFPNKYPGLTVDKIIQAIKDNMEFEQDDIKKFNFFKEKIGMPIIMAFPMMSGYAYPPLDFLFDYLRGFEGTTIDLRRRGKDVKKASEILFDFVAPLLGINEDTTSMTPYPPVATMMHIPTFISAKYFHEYFLPTYEKLIYKVHELGGKMYVFLEGDWTNKYDWLNGLPKNFMTAIIEHDDIFEAKKKIGDNITLVGGMPMSLLKLGSKQECLDHAKKVIDECAPGGGFVFSTDKVLMSAGDCNIENLKAVNEFVSEYGIYI